MPTTTVPELQRKALRILETYGRTFFAAFVAQLILSGFNVAQIADIATAKKAGVAAVAAGLQAVLSALGLTLGKNGTVSLLPAKLDPATPPTGDLPVVDQQPYSAPSSDDPPLSPGAYS